MHLLTYRIFLFLLLFILSAGAQSAPSKNAELTAILQKLTEGTSPEHASQIADAIAASPALTEQLNSLTLSKKITEIRVIPTNAIQPTRGIRFGGSLDGTRLILATNLLLALRKNRAYDVVKQSDVLPNNTTFVIGHLAFHASTNDEMAKFDDEMKQKFEERSKATGQHDYTDLLLLSQRTRIENEASAFILGWNYMVDAATQANGGKTLTVEQASTLLVNLRYRFAFAKALELKEGGMQISNTGMIQLNEHNKKAIATALGTSPMADIQ